jgi:thiaminase/transcriptional activator TenA
MWSIVRLGSLGYPISIGEEEVQHEEPKSLADELFENSLDIAKSALDTCFIRGIKHGTLDPQKYGAYEVQDCAYVDHGSTILKLLAEKAQAHELPHLKEFADKHAQSWQGVAVQMLQMWHLTDPKAVALCDAVKNYQKFEERILDKYQPYYVILSLLPCQKLWTWLGEELKPYANVNNVYSSWINECSQPQAIKAAKEWDKFLEDHKEKLCSVQLR